MLLPKPVLGAVACQQTVNYPPNQGNLVNSEEFSGCTALVTITMDNSIQFIGTKAFWQCTSLTTVNLPSSLQVIKNSAFGYCTSLRTLTIPEGCETLEPHALEWTSSLQSLYIPSTLQKFDSYVLQGSGKTLALYLTEPSDYFTCISNKFLLTKDKVKIIAASPRVVNSDLNLLPAETKIIASESFGTSSLGSTVTFPSQIEEIHSQAFGGSGGMVYINIGPNVKYIGSNAFIGCDAIQSYTVDGSNQHYCSIDGVLYDKAGTSLMAFPPKKSGNSLTFPENIEEFGLNPFSGNGAIRAFYFSNGKMEGTSCIIDSNRYAIYTKGYKELKRVVPANVAFTLHSDCETIGYAACTACNFHGITIPAINKLSLVESYAFYASGIQSFDFTNVYCKDNSFHGARLTSVTVPGWWGQIENAVFYSTTILTKAVLKSGITHVHSHAFNSPLTQGLELPDTLEEIGYMSFWGCGFPSLTLPDKSLKYIRQSAFEACTHFSDLYIPACVLLVEDFAFSTCSKVTTVIFENCNTRWTPNSFYGIDQQTQPTCVATRFFTKYMPNTYQRYKALISFFGFRFIVRA